MPSGLKRSQRAESLHFITFSCFHRLPLLETPHAKETVEAVLEQTRERHRARVYAYVLMPEHVHLLINEPPEILLAQLLKAVKQITSRKLRGPREKFWQARYYDSNVRGEKGCGEVIRYIHRNPVTRGWSKSPKTGRGRASAITRPEPRAQSRSNRSGLRSGGAISCQMGCGLWKASALAFPPNPQKAAAWMGHRPSRDHEGSRT